MRLWRHPYWQSALTTIGELLALLVYILKKKFYDQKYSKTHSLSKQENAFKFGSSNNLNNTSVDLFEDTSTFRGPDETTKKKKLNIFLFAIPAVFE
jgi:hypothetical protein